MFSPLNFQTVNLFYLPLLTILLSVQPSHSRPFLALIITICGFGNCERNVKIASQGTVLIEQDLYATFGVASQGTVLIERDLYVTFGGASQGTVLIEQDLYVTFGEGGAVSTMLR
jgi:hypothetical protein